MISKADNQRKRQKNNLQSLRSYFNKPYAFANMLFSEAKCGILYVTL